jgi:hypothetical protein
LIPHRHAGHFDRDRHGDSAGLGPVTRHGDWQVTCLLMARVTAAALAAAAAAAADLPEPRRCCRGTTWQWLPGRRHLGLRLRQSRSPHCPPGPPGPLPVTVAAGAAATVTRTKPPRRPAAVGAAPRPRATAAESRSFDRPAIARCIQLDLPLRVCSQCSCLR